MSSLREEVASLGAEVSQLNSGGSRDDTGVPIAALAPLIDEIGGLREEVAALKRRISLRASGKP